MSNQPVEVRVPKGTELSDEAREKILAEAIKVRFRAQLALVPESHRSAWALATARRLLDLVKQCGEQHLVPDAASHLLLTGPTQEECASIDEMINQIVEIHYVEPKSVSSKVSDAVKSASGHLWVGIRRALGLPDVAPVRNTATVAGPRA